jgi:hypothetical protein
MELINGRGQLGEALSKLDIPGKGYIYHTWNHMDKDERVQMGCYENFREFVRRHCTDRVVLISTTTQNQSPYLRFKQMAERKADTVIRLPTLVGKGTCERFRDGSANAYGEMELLTVDEAAIAIKHILERRDNLLSYDVKGHKVDAGLAKALIQFGVGALTQYKKDLAKWYEKREGVIPDIYDGTCS